MVISVHASTFSAALSFYFYALFLTGTLASRPDPGHRFA